MSGLPRFPSRFGRIASLLTGAGVILLIAGAVMAGPDAAPYVASRLYHVPSPQASIPTPADAVASSVTPGAALLPSFAPTAPPYDAAPPPPPTVTPRPAARPITRILIPSIGVDATVVPTGWEMADVGGSPQPIWSVPAAPLAGWHEESAGIGVPGNIVISGHNWPQDGVFRDLYRVQPGERVVLYSGRTPFVYEVTQVLMLREADQPLEVRQANARYIQPTTDERLTLVTCHPYGSIENRLVVIARPVPPTGPGAGEE